MLYVYNAVTYALGYLFCVSRQSPDVDDDFSPLDLLCVGR